MSYTTQAKVEAILKRSLTSDEETQFALLGSVVEAVINGKIGGSFGTVSASSKYYNGGTRYLDIDACHTITAVLLVDEDDNADYTYTEGDDYVAYPLNDTIKKSIHKRFDKFPSGLKNIKVTAQFTLGDSVPDDIDYLTAYLISKILTKPIQEIKSESIEGYSRTFAETQLDQDPVCKSILDSYTDDEVFI